MLFGQDLRRRHQRTLSFAVDCGQQRRQRDDRLAGADVALQETVHRQWRGEVGRDITEYSTLRARQSEVVSDQESSNEGSRRVGERSRTDVKVLDVDRVTNARRGLLEATAPKGQEQLQPQELVEGESSSRGLYVGEVRRQVDPSIRRRAIDQIEFGERSFRYRIEHWSGAAQTLVDETADLPTGQSSFARRRVDRHDAADSRGVSFIARGSDDHVDDGVRHLALTPVVRDLAKEQRLDANGELIFAPTLIEEDDFERSAVVTDAGLDHDPTVLRATTFDLGHFAEDRGLLTNG